MDLNATWYHADIPFPNGWKYVPRDPSKRDIQDVSFSNWVDEFNSIVEHLVIRKNQFIPE